MLAGENLTFFLLGPCHRNIRISLKGLMMFSETFKTGSSAAWARMIYFLDCVAIEKRTKIMIGTILKKSQEILRQIPCCY